jgi:putative MATE family efflux protein
VTAVGNGVLEWVLIVGFGRGIGASALATVLAQYVAGLVYVVKVVGAANGLGAELRFIPARVVRLLVVGLHLLVRTAALRGSLLVGVAVATRLGTTEVAAYEVAFQIWTLLALALDALAIAAQALVGHALGAGDADGARRVGRSALRLSLWAGVLFAVVLLAGRTPVAALFSNDDAVVALTGFSLLFVAAMQPLNGLVFALDGILIGAGDERFLARAMAVAFAAYAPCAVAVWATEAGLGWLWGALLLFMATRWLVLQRRFDGDRWLVTGAVR